MAASALAQMMLQMVDSLTCADTPSALMTAYPDFELA
jgi:hypothetical protein